MHHEDVRRANRYAPRAYERTMNDALWRIVRMGGPYLARRLRGAGLVLHWAGTAQTVIVRRAEPTARITGLPGELLLYLFGGERQRLSKRPGSDPAIEAVRSGRFGM